MYPPYPGHWHGLGETQRYKTYVTLTGAGIPEYENWIGAVNRCPEADFINPKCVMAYHSCWKRLQRGNSFNQPTCILGRRCF